MAWTKQQTKTTFYKHSIRNHKMAQLQLASILIHTPPGSADFQANDTIAIYWDDVFSSIIVKKNGTDWSGSSGAYFGDLITNYYVSGTHHRDLLRPHLQHIPAHKFLLCLCTVSLARQERFSM